MNNNPFTPWTHGTFLPPGHPDARQRRYHPIVPTPQAQPNPGELHPHWFGAELRAILVKHPEAHQTVCEWLARLHAEGREIPC